MFEGIRAGTSVTAAVPVLSRHTVETVAAPPPPSAAASTTEAPEEGVAVAAAVGTEPPGVKADTGVDSGRPHKPILAGAAIVGAALIAIPLLLVGSAKDEACSPWER
ncbi:hypothetical protein [Streptomyces sp. NBC_01217]|uniref:hypothetical protein n=1 Tax=Streptomyces sp. NBC_01217 TaxID=2903779 RepID=UPI002E0FFF0B|nr:hypothetical protein OG507_30960 [Streptomyces sp. NBC_01217]